MTNLKGLLGATDIVDLREETSVNVITSLFNIGTLGSHGEPGGGHLHWTILAAEGFSQLVERIFHTRDLLVCLGRKRFIVKILEK